MPDSDAKKRYDARTARRFALKLNINTDGPIIQKLEAQENVQRYIKDLIRADIEKEDCHMMTYHIKPEFLSYWGSDATEETVITDEELLRIAYGWETTPAALMDQLIPDRPRQISVNNGRSWTEPEDAIAAVGFGAIVNMMDDEVREAVHAEGYDSDVEFLTRYLELSPFDLVIG